jgi:hypothetical protein
MDRKVVKTLRLAGPLRRLCAESASFPSERKPARSSIYTHEIYSHRNDSSQLRESICKAVGGFQLEKSLACGGKRGAGLDAAWRNSLHAKEWRAAHPGRLILRKG